MQTLGAYQQVALQKGPASSYSHWEYMDVATRPPVTEAVKPRQQGLCTSCVRPKGGNVVRTQSFLLTEELSSGVDLLRHVSVYSTHRLLNFELSDDIQKDICERMDSRCGNKRKSKPTHNKKS